jgi:molybdopterin/thiamine biosynthesis adenylyltransferase
MDKQAIVEQMNRLSASTVGPDGQTRQILPLAATRHLANAFGLSRREVEILALQYRILPTRYERNLGTIGWEGQIKLLESTVAIVGAGGLGGWIIDGLARMGVGRLIVIDGDVFEESNLNRQGLCTETTLGQSKAEAAHARVAAVNGAVEVIAHPVVATEEALPELLRGADVVVDALDALPTRLVLQRVTQRLDLPLVHAAIGGNTGEVMTIFPGDDGLIALYGHREVPARGIEAQLGNPAATPMVAAAWEIAEVVKLLLGLGEPLRHRLLFIDMESGTIEVIQTQ